MKDKQILLKMTQEQYQILLEKVSLFNKENQLDLSVQSYIRRQLGLNDLRASNVDK